MKKFLILFTVLFSINSFSQEINYKEYSYSQFFKMIEEEKDSVFILENTVIKPDYKTDKKYFIDFDLLQDGNPYKEIDSLYKINKEIKLTNVQFQPFINKEVDVDNPRFATLLNLEFLKPVSLNNVANLIFYKVKFNYQPNVRFTSTFKKSYNIIRSDEMPEAFAFVNCLFNDGIVVSDNYTKNEINVQFFIYNSLLKSQTALRNKIFPTNSKINFNNFMKFEFNSNQVEGKGAVNLILKNVYNLQIANNTFADIVRMNLELEKNLSSDIFNNKFRSKVLLNAPNILNSSINLDYNQFDKNLLSTNANSYFFEFINDTISNFKPDKERWSKRNINYYQNHVLVENNNAFKIEIKFKGQLHALYKQQFDNEYANKVYIEIKDLETKRLEYLFLKSPTFDTYFTWKTNQFLKVFSAYGTKPSKAIIFSMYVILLFAFIYLLFPNSWDAHGRKRIMNRYAFFFKYMNKKAGIHEVYLDNQKEDLLEFDEFKILVEQQGKTVPKFFTATALPLYKWAISGTKFSASVLKRVDIMKGTWVDLPKSKRIWKSILLIGAFLIAICYDIFIKMLNALMLSINTFTTLGFGEIPIKGLPRYLAIIQGFIGWFMLTIFSVSLISQLLN
ncbi:potassium channel family protein [Polaribacter uvawellassae]|uniref:potassium channel family protein n=1 Tax=Polaribacter uvawellassae TaxID=3133495 RepID=UPI00321B249B